MKIAAVTIAASLATGGVALAGGFDMRDSTNSPKLIAPDGRYLGNLNDNPYDQNSINNPYGQYGNPYDSNSVNNPFGPYGNPYSPQYSNPYGERE